MENKTELELLQSMQEKLERIERRQRAERRGNRILFIVIILALVLLAWSIVPKVITMVNQYNAVMDKIDEVSKALSNVDFDSVTKMFNSLSSVDFDGLKEKMAQVENIIDNVSILDINAINNAVEKMNTALDPLLKLFKR